MVLRKEIKLGLGIAAAVLGIALVYGLMAMLSANSRTPSQATDEAPPAVADGNATGSDTGPLAGLPPREDAAKPANPSANGDPFAENARNDGSKSDPWTEALNTGKIPADTGIMSNQTSGGAVQTASAAGPNDSKNDSKNDAKNDSSGPIVTQVPTGLTPVVGPARSAVAGVAGGGGHRDGSTATASASATASATAGTTYTVQAGDTFTRIATKLYGDRRLAAALIKANPNIEPTKLRTGVAIVVPAKDEVATARGSLAPVATELTGTVDTSRQYRVVAGDTLHRIATKLYGYAGMWESIYEDNKAVIGADPGHIKVGQMLTLPKPPTKLAA